MKPDYESPGVQLYRGDCLEIMPTLPDGNADAVITDPPYGTTQCKWDDVIPLDGMWIRLKRVSRARTPIVFFASQPFSSTLICSNIEMFKYDWVWKKPKGTGHLNAKKQPMRDKEDIVVFYTKQCVYNPQMLHGSPYKDKAGKDHESRTSMTESYGEYSNYREDNMGTRYPKQVLEFGVVERNTVHPTQKPIPLMEYLIKTYTNEGDTVLDFAMGSGTTGVACVNTGRKFIGIEIEQEYFDIAVQRIEEAQQQASLL